MYPLLAKLARGIFCIPATSATSERVFSASGHIISDRRTRLASITVEKLVFVHQNFNSLKDNVKDWNLDNPDEPQSQGESADEGPSQIQATEGQSKSQLTTKTPKRRKLRKYDTDDDDN